MITKISGSYRLICDVCGEAADEEFYEFQEAVDYKKADGWGSEYRNGEWWDICPECQTLEA